MGRQRAPSTTSTNESAKDVVREQELGSMYDYLAKIILLGPSGTGKSCLLHRFVKHEWRVLSSQTIGVEFSSRIVKVGTGARRKRIKLQLWDTAGTERFRSVSRSYYRGAAGAILVYDIASHASFTQLPTFLNDARALASPQLTVLLAGNKNDLTEGDGNIYDVSSPQPSLPTPTPSSLESRPPSFPFPPNTPTSSSIPLNNTPSANAGNSSTRSRSSTLALKPNTYTTSSYGREVTQEEASTWASRNAIPVCVETSALSGENVEELFSRLARMILTKIELGEIDPDDPASGIQYGDSGWGGGGGTGDDGGSVKSGMGLESGGRGRRGRGRKGTVNGWMQQGMREWEEVFRSDGRGRRSGCC